MFDGNGTLRFVTQRACPLWEGLHRLEEAIAAIVAAGECSAAWHAVTMTAELCDLFASRAEGVIRIAAALPGLLTGRTLLYGAAGWHRPQEAGSAWQDIASMNWHATARLAARDVQAGVLLDIGSTTSDLVPFADGRAHATGMTDVARFAAGELVYTGIARTPVMAVSERLAFAGRWQAIAAERFATMADVYRVLEELPPDADQYDTADGRPADLAHSLARLARMLGADAEDENGEALRGCARQLRTAQLRALDAALAQILSRTDLPAAAAATLVAAGAGAFLVPRLAAWRDARVLDFASLAGAPSALWSRAAQCAPAVAVARLAAAECR
jgi:probable H4MPT-linked C1 transfer pathway protein